MFLAMGMLAAIIEARNSGKGQVVDAAIVDGAVALTTAIYGLHAAGLWDRERGSNVLDSGAPYYDVYQCKCGGYVSIGAIESRFYGDLVKRLDLDAAELGDQNDKASWPRAKAAVARAFQTRSRDEWCAELEGTDVCFAPVLSFDEAPRHPHFIGRESFIEVDGVVQPAPAPRFSRTPSVTPTGPQGLAPQRLITPWPAGSKPRQYARGNDEASLARKQCKPRPCAREVSTAQAGLKPGTRSRYVLPLFSHRLGRCI
jgi:crotonobetainyl-CoA:carnitine CoA-transferase CaiB-like acyl-CoA transferase